MPRRVRLVVFCLGVFVGCASQQEVPSETETPEEPNLEQESDVISDSIPRIAIGSPESLELAILDLGFSAAIETDRGVELQNVASEIFAILYPLLEPPADITISFSPASVYGGIFESIRNGTYPEIPQESVNFLTLITSSLAVLFSDDQGVAARAEEALIQVESLAPESIVPDLLLGTIAERAGDFDRAELRYLSAAEKSDLCYTARLGLARISVERGDHATALEYIAAPLEDLPGDISASIPLLEVAARTYFLGEETGLAGDFVTRALLLEPDGDTFIRLVLLRAQVNAAQGNYSRAGNFLTIVEQRRPDDAGVLLLRVELLSHDEDYAEARRVAERAIELYPEDQEILDVYGRLLFLVGEVEEGRKILEGSLGEAPSNTENLLVLLDDALASERFADAAGYLDRLIEIDERVEYLDRTVIVQIELDNIVAASEYAARRYLLAPDDPDAIKGYAKLLIQLGEMQTAEGVLDDGIEGTSDSVDLSDFYYLKSLVTEDVSERVFLLGEALFTNAQNVEALIAYSEYWESTGDLKRATRYMRQAAALRSDDEVLQERYNALSQQAGN